MPSDTKPKPFTLHVSDQLFVVDAVKSFAAHEASIRKRIVASGHPAHDVEAAVKRVIGGAMQLARAIADELEQHAYWLDERDPRANAPTPEDRKAAPALIKRAAQRDAKAPS